MSDPKFVTDKSPKFILGIQKNAIAADDLPATIKSNEQLELRGSLTSYGSLTINGKLYITQELGF